MADESEGRDKLRLDRMFTGGRENMWGGVSEGLSFACCSSSPGASLEAAHKLFKLDSVNLSPAAVLAWSDPARHHTRSNRFCCFTDCRIRSIHRLVKVGHGSS